MAKKNQVNCGTKGQFVHGKKGYKFGRSRWLVLSHPRKDILADADLEDMKTNLQEKLEDNDWKNQIFLIGPLVAPENNGEAVAYESVGKHKNLVDDGTIDKYFTIEAGGLCDRAMLNKFHGRNWDMSEIDHNDVLKVLSSDTGIKGMPGHAFEVLPEDLITEGAGGKVRIRVAYSNINDWNKNATHIDLGFSADELNGVETFIIEDVTPDGAADGIHRFAIRSICPDCNDGENNLNELYKTEFTNTACFAPVNESGAALSIISIAPVLEGTVCVSHEFTMSLADTDYHDGEIANMKFASISALKAIINVAATADPVPFTMKEA